MGTEMTYNEAVDLVLGFRERTGRIPTQNDYEKRIGLDANKLARALGINTKTKSKKDGPIWAAVNIEVVHAERRRNGQPVEIESDPMSKSNSNLFENRYEE